MGKNRVEQQKALQGSLRAVTRTERRGKPKIGKEEFLSVAQRFGLSKRALSQVSKILDGEDWGAGPFLANYYSNLKETKVQEFERVARTMFQVKYALGLSSGTAALHCAMVGAGVGPGTEVICSAIGFFATAAAVVAAKGIPVFCDVDESLHMDPQKIESLISDRTVAIAPTHVMGGVCDMGPIMSIARKHNLKVIEDCAQSCGATYKGKYVGTIGDVGCFSISAYKIVGGGEGGLLLTNDQRIWERAANTAECGGLWRPDRFAPPRYEDELFCGTNYRMSELEAAVDVPQLRKMPATVNRFRNVRNRILSRLKSYRGVTPQKSNDKQGEIGYLVRFFPESYELGERIVRSLREREIPAGMRGPNAPPDWHIYHWMFPITLQAYAGGANCPFYCPLYKERGGNIKYKKGDCPVADDLFDRVINISLNQWLTASDCREFAKRINDALAEHCPADPTAPSWF
ncbi:MAG TPA: aminotransferase class V-fold PLP-dependent enzyme [Candidatus Hydrogenedentes bacterium]|nr:aminotransferase class V-fold PLP-dependent enzyme [Candidatus Hydrogenedentota bacterium]HOL75650.1 aminotransferase class V-fold PLP-dependent enzyme [Candidatus Hydrogenedentota bacterium]HPO84357.1 aminotransferase class V-fold PLP-dependent enzyme [Candidatus Hydrogenedentota bacterium]